MTESAPLLAVRRFYESEARYSASGGAANRDALLATLHPNIVLHQPSSLPYGGEWRGREGFGRWLDRFTRTWTDIVPTDAKLYPQGEDMLFCTVTMRARSRDTGAAIHVPMCQVIRIAEGAPIEWRNFAWDTADMLAALNAPKA